MRIIVHAEDRSGRGDGYYTKESIGDALDVFFRDGSDVYRDSDCEEPMTRSEAEEIFRRDREVVFHGEDGDRITLALDWSSVNRPA